MLDACLFNFKWEICVKWYIFCTSNELLTKGNCWNDPVSKETLSAYPFVNVQIQNFEVGTFAFVTSMFMEVRQTAVSYRTKPLSREIKDNLPTILQLLCSKSQVNTSSPLHVKKKLIKAHYNITLHLYRLYLHYWSKSESIFWKVAI